MSLPPPTLSSPPDSTPESAHALWSDLVTASGRTLLPAQIDRLELYLARLIRVNEVMNLTRISDPQQGRLLHIADALTLLPFIHTDTRLLADVGSGGGIPGLILGIMLPDTNVVLIEATQKKAKFLAETADALGLTNVEVRGARAEDAGRSDLRDQCDVVTARAVGALVWLAEWCLPLTRKGGKVLAMKGPKLTEELPEAARAITSLNGGKPLLHPITTLPGLTNYVICEIPKIGATDPKYPRDPTISKGKPLGSRDEDDQKGAPRRPR